MVYPKGRAWSDGSCLTPGQIGLRSLVNGYTEAEVLCPPGDLGSYSPFGRIQRSVSDDRRTGYPHQESPGLWKPFCGNRLRIQWRCKCRFAPARGRRGRNTQISDLGVTPNEAEVKGRFAAERGCLWTWRERKRGDRSRGQRDRHRRSGAGRFGVRETTWSEHR